MKVVVNENTQLERTIEVFVEARRVDQSFDRHLSDFIRSISIPGFRKGKAPRKIAERFANKEQLRRNVFEDVGVPAYQEAISQEKLDPVGQPSLELVQLEPGKDLIFKATFEVKPEVQLDASEYEGLEVEVGRLEVDEADVDRILEDMRKKHERTVAVEEERPLQRGDLAVVDFASRIGDEPVPNGAAENFSMDVDDSLFVAGFADNLVDMAIGEKKTFDVAFPAEYGNKSLAGQNVTFDFELKSIKKRELPDLDDDLAKEASRFSTLDELKADLRERLAANLRNELGNRALEKLATTREIPIPRAYLQQMTGFMIENQARQLAQVGISFEDFMKSRNMSIEQIVASVAPSAERMARAELIMDAIVRNEGLAISDEELHQEMHKYAESTGQDFDKVHEALHERGEAESLRRDVLRHKVIESLAGKVKPVLKAAEAEAAEGAEPAAEATEETAEAKPRARKGKADAAAPNGEESEESKPARKTSRAKKAKAEDASSSEETVEP